MSAIFAVKKKHSSVSLKGVCPVCGKEIEIEKDVKDKKLTFTHCDGKELEVS